MALEDKVATLTIQLMTVGADQVQSALNQTGQSAGTLQSVIDGLGGCFDGISKKLDMVSRSIGATGAAFDSIGLDAASASAAQFSGRLSEVSGAFDTLSGGLGYVSTALGTHTSAINQAVDRYGQLSTAQQGAADSSGMSTAAWIAAGVAGVALIGVTAGLVVGALAVKDAIEDAADATAHSGI